MKIDTNRDIKIVRYSGQYRAQLLDVWEGAVLATHNFLTSADFQSIKEIVKTIDFNMFEVYCLFQANTVIGFIGVLNQKIEMLFLSLII